MSLRRRTLLSSGLAGLAPAFLNAPAHAAGVSSAEIVLGTHLDLSGPAAITMPPIRNGLQMRVDEANEAGGMRGRSEKGGREAGQAGAQQGTTAKAHGMSP